MKVLFAGPSLAEDRHALADANPGIRFAGPAARGDVLSAVQAGATAIGIVDGVFGGMPPVWHKEILFALSRGVAVAGGGSMGALRAAECAAFGMVGLGEVHARIADGRELDDGFVAQLHEPGILGWRAITEAKVTVDATIEALAGRTLLSPAERSALAEANASIHFTSRTMRSVADAAALRLGRLDDARRLEALLTIHRADIKRADAHLVLGWLADRPDRPDPPPTGWRFAETPAWRALLDEVGAAPEPSP